MALRFLEVVKNVFFAFISPVYISLLGVSMLVLAVYMPLYQYFSELITVPRLEMYESVFGFDASLIIGILGFILVFSYFISVLIRHIINGNKYWDKQYFKVSVSGWLLTFLYILGFIYLFVYFFDVFDRYFFHPLFSIFDSPFIFLMALVNMLLLYAIFAWSVYIPGFLADSKMKLRNIFSFLKDISFNDQIKTFLFFVVIFILFTWPVMFVFLVLAFLSESFLPYVPVFITTIFAVIYASFYKELTTDSRDVVE